MSEGSVRDRSREFFLTCQTERERLENSALSHRKRFSQKAAQIGKDIHRTAEKLAKLTKLAKSKSLFDDPATEISELSYIITQDIQRLNEDLEELSNIHSIENPPNAQSNEHAGSVKKCLQSNLKTTAEKFAAVLQMRSENLQRQQDRRNEYSSAKSFAVSSQPSFLREGEHTDSHANGGEVVIELGMPMQDLTQEYAESRALSVQDIEKSINELASVFSKLGEMVSLQQEQIERIDTNMDEALHHVDQGHTQLMKYYQTLTSNRGLMAKIFLVLLISMVLLIIFGT
ncbi:syntaxin 5 [Guillardia theta CCMP2712]|uniref:Syntaxin 5 n=1 Tax=Guillardia theta (strain CCMP2712) TaxID=905079 RepID=L1JC87_GUITC|nr:syntaxin 5 [Guillardia theta CCMP2712]EKX45724.1 syntaxin 5 [Guillardia theta CCMP2712]|eukprot:XP_005832704.1 syntaxin 5 [Guillardia theta CCMP2712]